MSDLQVTACVQCLLSEVAEKFHMLVIAPLLFLLHLGLLHYFLFCSVSWLKQLSSCWHQFTTSSPKQSLCWREPYFLCRCVSPIKKSLVFCVPNISCLLEEFLNIFLCILCMTIALWVSRTTGYVFNVQFLCKLPELPGIKLTPSSLEFHV